MAYQLWIADAAREAGLKVVEQPGWKTRGSKDFDPQAVIAHHTVIDDDLAAVRVVRDGRPDLEGPLSQFVLGKDGTVYVIAAGKANHAGEGIWKGISGNTHFLGIEGVNKGDGTPWPVVQLDAYKRLVAALLKHMKKSAEYVAGHKEYATPKGRKIDPRGIDMLLFRSDVAKILSPPPKEFFKQMYNPPLDLGKVVAYLPRPGGVIILNEDGDIYAFGSKYKDAPNRHPEYWPPGSKAVGLYELGTEGYYVIAKGASDKVGSAGWYAYP